MRKTLLMILTGFVASAFRQILSLFLVLISCTSFCQPAPVFDISSVQPKGNIKIIVEIMPDGGNFVGHCIMESVEGAGPGVVKFSNLFEVRNGLAGPPWGEGSEHTIIGTVSLRGYTFQSQPKLVISDNQSASLRFKVTSDGYLLLSGTGKVVFPDGSIWNLTTEPKVIISDSRPYITQGTVMVPMRAIFEWLGAEVGFDTETGLITATRDDQVVSLKAGSKTATVKGEKKALSAPAENKSGRTFVPLRFVAEAFGAEVAWDAPSQTVTVRQAGREIVLEVATATGANSSGASKDSSQITLSKDKEVVVHSLPATFVEGTSVRLVKRDTGPRDVRFLGTIPLPPGTDPKVGMMTLLPNMDITKSLEDYMGTWSCPMYVREETYCPLNCERISVVGDKLVPFGPDWLQAGPNGAEILRKEGRKVILTEGSAVLIKSDAR